MTFSPIATRELLVAARNRRTFWVRLGMAGSDPRHLAPNYSCAITVLRTDAGREGRSLVFTIGAGTEIQKAAIEALRPFIVGRDLEEFIAEPGLFAQALTESAK